MKMTKGCLNPNCELSKRKSKQKDDNEINRLKRTFKHDDNYCLKCGKELSYVCKTCNTYLLNDDENTCERCKAASADKMEKNAKAAAGVVAGVGGVAAVLAKPIIKVITKK